MGRGVAAPNRIIGAVLRVIRRGPHSDVGVVRRVARTGPRTGRPAGAARRVRRAASLGVIALLAALLAGAPVSAAPTGTIGGALVNATTGKPLSNAAVRLYWSRGQETQAEREARTDARGRYVFRGLPVGEEYAYVAYARHAGVEYTGARLTLSAQRPAADATLRVYDSTPLDRDVRVKAASIVVLDVNKATQTLYMLETFTFENRSRRTFRPVVDGPRGPMGLLRFSLPPNAGGLAPMGELASREVIQTDRGFGTDLPVRPGTSAVSFSYQTPYRDPAGALDFELTLPYPTDEFRLLTPQGAPPIRSAQLRPDKPVALFQSPDNTFDAQLGTRLPARTRVVVTASGLPVNVHPLRPENPWLWAGSGGLVLLLLFSGLLLARRASAPGRLDGDDGGERSRLVAQLAALDVRYERGELSEDAYLRERELRRQRLLAVLATSPQPQ